jgi:exosortase
VAPVPTEADDPREIRVSIFPDKRKCRREGQSSMAQRAEATADSSDKQSTPFRLADLVSHLPTEPPERAAWIGLAVCMSLFLLVFWEVLGQFCYSWTTDENYSHGFLVPLISLYFAYQVARQGPVPVRAGTILGAVLLSAAILLRLVTVALPIPFLAEIAFLVGLAGLACLLFGRMFLRRYWFAFFFLVFMVPLPVALYAKIASPLQLLASRVASAVMNGTGVPVLREGNKMTLPGGTQLFVAEACSGMRQLTGFLALTTAVAYLSARPIWYRIIVLISALPIALSANIARVVLTGYVMHFVNPEYALGTYHTVEGLLMMGFGLLLLNSECWVLDRFLRREETPGPGVATPRSLAVEPA